MTCAPRSAISRRIWPRGFPTSSCSAKNSASGPLRRTAAGSISWSFPTPWRRTCGPIAWSGSASSGWYEPSARNGMNWNSIP
ncbi:MAG: hypothetical protein D6722_22190 [Bacteroidetes bacterium]|nr:MAG: hypothetical protein D6722_22190 [Bacteroidota bacterium]